MTFRMTALVVAICAAGLDQHAVAQAFRVSTHVSDLRTKNDSGRHPVVASSMTLFRNRKSYDYIPALGEVIIREPTHRRFTILSTTRSLATTVDFDEVRHLLKLRDKEVERLIRKLSSQTGAGQDSASRAIEGIRFQMAPRFVESFDSGNGQLRLSSPLVSYEVNCASASSDEALATYLDYADSIAQLNYLLDSQSLFPELRMAVNASLRRRRRLPRSVTLKADIEQIRHLQAEHRFAWKLDPVDLRLIEKWERQLRDNMVKRTPFPEYQRAILVSHAESAR